MTVREKTISDLDTQIRWIRDIPAHQFPGWMNTTNAMCNAILALEEQPEIIRCKDCKRVETCCRRKTNDPNWFCADGERNCN